MFAGTKTLIRLVLRRDRIKLPIWVVAIVGLLLAMIPMLRDIYGDEQGLATLYQTFGTNPAGLFLTGPMDGPTFGALMTIETVLWWGLAVAFMNTLLIIRHTRQNEERGAQELILSGQVHRGSGLVASLVVAFFANFIIVIGLGLGMGILESSWSFTQAWLFALSLGLFGFVWAAVAAVVAQLVEGSRFANGILAGLIGISFIIRGIGDFTGKVGADGLIQPAWISWLSPFGWMQATRALTFPNWQPLLVMVIFPMVVIPVAFFMLGQRDDRAGILPSRKGRARASSFLKTPLGHTWYLQKNIFLGWLAGMLVYVLTIGALSSEMTSIYDSSDSMKDLIVNMGGSGALMPTFLSAMLMFAVLLILAYCIHGLGRLRSEESSGHLENLLATRLSRLRWLSLHSLVIMAGGVIMLVVSGAVLALAVNYFSEFNTDVLGYTLAGLSYAPLLMLIIGCYILLFGLLPRVAGMIMWIYYGFMAFMSWLGPMLQVDQQIMNLSLITHTSAAPAEAVVWPPLIVMLLIGLSLAVIGVWRFRHRDIVER